MKRTPGVCVVQRSLACCLLFLAGAAVTKGASDQPQTGFVSVTEENDSLANPFGTHQDRHYTQGLKICLFGGDDCMPGLTNALNDLFPKWGIQPQASDIGLILLGQNIYTPNDLTNSAPIKTDRPYAGWLYTGAIYQRREESAPNFATMENFEVNVGVVGPDSIAQQAQQTVHRWWFSNDVPSGWDNQIKNEPGLVLKYERLWRLSPTPATARYIDILPRVGGDLGNVFTFATGGAMMRLGYDLPPDFGPQIIDSPGAVNGGLTRREPWCFAYAFSALDGRAVGHDITLDGNSFQKSPSIQKNIFVADVTWGVALQVFRHVEVTYAHIIRTEEFKGQDGNDILGSITIKGKFCF
ncbi:MAG TPA: lipid A deacylase LpxR family protein [Verrucomicrobiae bacterium]|nr:lipid A deacylase LpxR family protein [Verrucomicrobiae bacterium]